MACGGETRPRNMARTRPSITVGNGGAIKGIFAQMMVGLAAEHGEEKTVMIDATYLKAHRTASSLGVKKGGVVA